MFDVEALRTLVTGIDQGSFARAAIQLGRSQSAVSMQLKKLEAQAEAKLLVRDGRKLVLTEAGEALLDYARRIIALNDEAAVAVGAKVPRSTVRLGLPQDFFEDVMPATLSRFATAHPDVHVEVRAGMNHILADEIHARRLDGAIAFFKEGKSTEGELLCKMRMRWLTSEVYRHKPENGKIPLVLFDHPCLFRQAALSSLDQDQKPWQVSLTTPSLQGIWGALRSGLGIAVRTVHGKPDDIVFAEDHLELPELPLIEVRLLKSSNLTHAAQGLCEFLRHETLKFVANT